MANIEDNIHITLACPRVYPGAVWRRVTYGPVTRNWHHLPRRPVSLHVFGASAGASQYLVDVSLSCLLYCINNNIILGNVSYLLCDAF